MTHAGVSLNTCLHLFFISNSAFGLMGYESPSLCICHLPFSPNERLIIIFLAWMSCIVLSFMTHAGVSFNTCLYLLWCGLKEGKLFLLKALQIPAVLTLCDKLCALIFRHDCNASLHCNSVSYCISPAKLLQFSNNRKWWNTCKGLGYSWHCRNPQVTPINVK